MRIRRYEKVDHTGKTNQRFWGNKNARIPIISVILMVAFVGIFAAMVATYVFVPEPTPVPIPRPTPTPKPTPPPETSEVENLRFENVVAYASERSTGEQSFDTVVMQVTGTGAVSLYEVVGTVNGIGGKFQSTGGTSIQPGDEVTFVSIEKYAACGCVQPIVEIEPGGPVHVIIRYTKTPRHVFVDTTVTAIAGP